jgi:ubiquinone/menaquinone biosynthesis C-methylase UbiE
MSEDLDKTVENRYAKDWNNYSKMWDGEFGSNYSHLGEEWNDDGTAERSRDSFYFKIYAERFINLNTIALEVGPGGGKWTVLMAPKVKKLIALDVADEMLKRTKERCESQNISNVEYILSDGVGFTDVPDESIDFFFSRDVFVHIAMEDTFIYAQEMNRVLVPGGIGICHYAINSVPEAWERIAENNHWYRGGRHTLGQYYYYSPESLRRMFEFCGLSVIEQHQEVWNCTCIFRKPSLQIEQPSSTSLQGESNHLRQREQLAQIEIQRLRSESQKLHATVENYQRSRDWLQERWSWAQGEIERLKLQHNQLRERQDKIRTKKDQMQANLSVAQEQLNHAQQKIKAMESSKFWKLRKIWFGVKRSIGLREDE